MGRVVLRRPKTLSVKIPAGVDTGDRIRLTGEGEAGVCTAHLQVIYMFKYAVREHPIFTRDGNNLYCEVPISFTTAAIGGEIEVPTLDGRANLEDPSRESNGQNVPYAW